jgi:flagellar biosynthesis activator protein FlaF
MTGYGAYDKNIKTTESPHETDAAVLEHAAQVLIAAQSLLVAREKNAEIGDFNDEDFFMALNYNQRIWTVLQAFALEENLPDQIKANLISLSLFVDKQTYKAMSDNDPKKLDVLININRQIAAGFRSIPPAEEKPA